jgi:hypothetical protein
LAAVKAVGDEAAPFREPPPTLGTLNDWTAARAFSRADGAATAVSEARATAGFAAAGGLAPAFIEADSGAAASATKARAAEVVGAARA